jgi:hypothetical protein
MQHLKQTTLPGESNDANATSRWCFRPSSKVGVDDGVSMRKSPDDIDGASD